MKFVKLRGAYDTSPDSFRKDGECFDLRVNPNNVESVGLDDPDPVINLVGNSRTVLYCDMTGDEVVAAFREAGVEL